MLDQTRPQRAPQLDALRKFARRKQISEDLVVEVYQRERDGLTRGAKIETYVDVLAEKRARHALGRLKR